MLQKKLAKVGLELAKTKSGKLRHQVHLLGETKNETDAFKV